MVSKKTRHNWFLYIIRASNGKLYTGITTDIERRFLEHKTSKTKRAKFFRASSPKTIVYTEKHSTRSKALKRECVIKSLSRMEKLALTKA